jgi:Arm DNA-binding domain
MALTDTAIRNAKPKEKPYKVTDAQGLYLLVNPRGSKLWRVKYRLNGVERKLALGSYLEITLAEARAARDAAGRRSGFLCFCDGIRTVETMIFLAECFCSSVPSWRLHASA